MDNNEINQVVSEDFENWLIDLYRISDEYDQSIEEIEKEIKVLRARSRVLRIATMTIEQVEKVYDGYVFEEKEKIAQEIKSKEIELENLQEHEWKKIYQVRKLIDSIKKERNKIEASV